MLELALDKCLVLGPDPIAIQCGLHTHAAPSGHCHQPPTRDPHLCPIPERWHCTFVVPENHISFPVYLSYSNVASLHGQRQCCFSIGFVLLV